MVMDLPTIHQLITVILQPTRSSVSKFIVGHICVLAGGGEDAVEPAREAAIRGANCTGAQRSCYLLMQIAVCVAFARACRHSERVLYGVACPPSDVTR